ncbi:sulfite reductase (NADPH) flavoprotein alpha-component [Geopseudomonas sagittaria]|uniref:Sulfite reductase (NADPH) flavoprotein alpha-component n=1 Tax=Geopseudomonas sagittaria TaxID=1135990 RepID=A0A1I5UWQ8_9GAMM|nr:sulfite reductase flavoprotein subunit alpha [Pseudomonas sagittaria]SFP99648.1 sulfite reductase (NADPH) flavoprotein alpha-component [Pseudomonas sagittaria]
MVKKILFQLHWLLGISAGLVLALMGVTGASLSYQDELLRLLNPGVMSVEPAVGARPLSPDELVGRVGEQLPNRQVLGLSFSADALDAVKVNVSGGGPRGETLYADPYSGEVLGAARGAGLFQFLMQLHRWLAIGDAGKPITGAATLALVFLCLSGLYLRWPRQAGNWRAWLTLDWRRTGRGFLWDLHAVAGTWVLLAYLLAALTGLYWSYEWYRDGVHALAGESAPQHGGPGKRRGPPPQSEAPPAPVSIDPLWNAFRHEVRDDYRLASLRLPERAGQPLQVMYLPQAAEHNRAFNRVSLDADGKLLQHERYSEKSDVQQLLASVYPLHTGDYFGQPGRILMLLASLGMPLFFITGWQLYLGRRRSRRAARAGRQVLDGASGNGRPWLIGFASQNGFAEQLAWQTAGQLQAAGATVQVRSLAQLDEQVLRGFVRRVLAGEFDLRHLEYALLGLGDRQYQRFCGFGRQLHDWLQGQGARSLFAPVEVDNGDYSALQRWHARLGELTGSTPPEAPAEPGFAEWTLRERQWLNPGSAAAPVWRLVFQVPAGQRWQAGDLVEILPRQAGARPRSYSIASLAEDGALELLVRLQLHADGTPGLCSGWLCVQLAEGATAPLRLRRNPGFRLAEDDRPLLLIGNGTGLASLRSLLRERTRRGQQRNWLLFGERSAAHDFLCRDELLAWQAEGLLQRLDLAFSRDQAERVYVQDRLREAAGELRAWLADGAAIYVCGSLKGMGEGVDGVLRELLGEAALVELQDSGRYRRDLY